jgi:hypothetical protein
MARGILHRVELITHDDLKKFFFKDGSNGEIKWKNPSPLGGLGFRGLRGAGPVNFLFTSDSNSPSLRLVVPAPQHQSHSKDQLEH